MGVARLTLPPEADSGDDKGAGPQAITALSGQVNAGRDDHRNEESYRSRPRVIVVDWILPQVDAGRRKRRAKVV